MNHIWIIARVSGYFGQSYFWDKPILNHQHILAFYGSSCISSDQCWCQPLWPRLPRRLCALQKCFFSNLSWSAPANLENKGKFTKTVWTSAALTFWSSYKWYQFLVGYPHPGKDWSLIDLIGILTSLYNHSHGAEDSCQRSWSGM